MTSVTLPRRAHHLRSIREHRNHHSCQTDIDDKSSIFTDNRRQCNSQPKLTKSIKAFSYDEPNLQLSLPTSPAANSNRLKQLCSKLKRRLTLTRDEGSRSEDVEESPSERRSVRFGNYESFSSTSGDQLNEFVWPDFERVYDTIPSCLISALPGPDDFSIARRDETLSDLSNSQLDPADDSSDEQMNSFTHCQRGKVFRRNAICHKLDKSQYNSQLDTFVQQLMVEKLMRTWT